MTAADATAGGRASRLSAIRELPVPTWAVGVLVAVLTWGIEFRYPSAGLDPSWGGGLYMAVHDGLDFGTQPANRYHMAFWP